MKVLRGRAVRQVRKEISYQSNPQWPTCGVCSYLLVNRVQNTLRCTRFHLAVGKHATCRFWKGGEPTTIDEEQGDDEYENRLSEDV